MWAISFWPQAVTNYKNQCTTGLKSDKLAYDLIGFECLVIYESSMYFSAYTRELYAEDHNGNYPEVQINDVWFANHSMLLTFIVIGQMMYYDGWKQWPTTVAVTICSILIFTQIFGLGVLAVYGPDIKAISFLTWLYLLSSIKVLITFLKFLPQVLFNYERKSTRGWSMPGTIMDLMGSVLSISQLVLDCYFVGDWKGVEGNFIKLGLGVISGTYDVIFIVQHYILYPGTGDQYHSPLGRDRERERVELNSSGQGLLAYRFVDSASDSGDSDGNEDNDEEEVFLSPFGGPERTNQGVKEDSAISSSYGRGSDTGRVSGFDMGGEASFSAHRPNSTLEMDVTWLAS